MPQKLSPLRVAVHLPFHRRMAPFIVSARAFTYLVRQSPLRAPKWLITFASNCSAHLAA